MDVHPILREWSCGKPMTAWFDSPLGKELRTLPKINTQVAHGSFNNHPYSYSTKVSTEFTITNLRDPSLSFGALDKPDVAALLAAGKPSPFGRGEQTIYDEAVRKGKELTADDIRIENEEELLKDIQRAIKDQLFPTAKSVSCRFYKLAMYEQGGHFGFHRDTTHADNHHATLLLEVKSAHKGGRFVVDLGGGKEQSFHFHERYRSKWVAFYTDVPHKVEPVLEGVRIALQYDVLVEGHQRDDAIYETVADNTSPSSAATAVTQDAKEKIEIRDSKKDASRKEEKTDEDSDEDCEDSEDSEDHEDDEEDDSEDAEDSDADEDDQNGKKKVDNDKDEENEISVDSEDEKHLHKKKDREHDDSGDDRPYLQGSKFLSHSKKETNDFEPLCEVNTEKLQRVLDQVQNAIKDTRNLALPLFHLYRQSSIRPEFLKNVDNTLFRALLATGKYHVALSPVVMHVDSNNYDDEWAVFYPEDYLVNVTELPRVAYGWDASKREIVRTLIGEGHPVNARKTKFIVTKRENAILLDQTEIGNTGNEGTAIAFKYFLCVMIVSKKK